MKFLFIIVLIFVCACVNSDSYRKDRVVQIYASGSAFALSYTGELGIFTEEDNEFGVEVGGGGIGYYEDNYSLLYYRWYLGNSFNVKLGYGVGSHVYDTPSYQQRSSSDSGQVEDEFVHRVVRNEFHGPAFSFGHRWIYLGHITLGLDYVNVIHSISRRVTSTENGEPVEPYESFDRDTTLGGILSLGLGLTF